MKMKQILIVEDDSFLNKILSYNLAADGYGITAALNAGTAAEALAAKAFDLVLLDINLPDGHRYRPVPCPGAYNEAGRLYQGRIRSGMGASFSIRLPLL